MRPSVGRIVHYTNLGDKDGKYPPQVQAAIITAIYKEGGDASILIRVDDGVGSSDDVISDAVDLKVFYKTGLFDCERIPMKSHEGQRGCWNWPHKV